MKLMLILLTN